MNLIKFVVLQLLSLLGVIVLLKLSPVALFSPWAIAGIQGLLASCLSVVLRQPYWWIPINLLFFPCALVMLSVDLDPGVYLVTLVLFTLIFWGTVKGDVPLFLSSTKVANIVAESLALEQVTQFADLGAGIGTIAVPVARQFPWVSVAAWERAPLPWLCTYCRSLGLKNVQLNRRSFWECDLAQYQTIFAFLSPVAMPQLALKVQQEMLPGSLLISSSFPIVNWEAEKIVQVDDRRQTLLYFYRVPKI